MAALVGRMSLSGRLLPSFSLHSCIEAAGSVIAIIVAGLSLLIREDDEEIVHARRFRACALIAMGTLDVFHASVSPAGDLFVWLRCAAMLSGGALFALAWLPGRIGRGRLVRRLPGLVAVAILTFGLLSVLFAGSLPAMVEGRTFTPTAVAMNVIGGAGFLAAAARLLALYRRAHSGEDLLFACICILLAAAALVFPLSTLWSADWWLWHIVRLGAYLVALTFLGTVYQRIEGRLESANRSLREALEVRDTFLSIASHELKTPLTAIRLRLENLSRTVRRGRPIDPDVIDKALGSTNRITGLIDDMLDVSRIRAGKLELHSEPTSLNAVARDVLASFRVVSGKHELVLTEPPEEIVVHFDRSRIEQVITNLLDNAIKYSPAGGPIRVDLSTQGGEAVISVADSGLGIPREQQPKLFEQFFRATNASAPSGLGLGLYICHQIAERHGGRIWVESRAGAGSTFYLALPHPHRTLGANGVRHRSPEVSVEDESGPLDEERGSGPRADPQDGRVGDGDAPPADGRVQAPDPPRGRLASGLGPRGCAVRRQ